MSRRTHHLVMALAVAGASLAAGGVPARADRDADRVLQADSLYRRALRRLADSTLESRNWAIRDLDQASRWAPTRTDVWRDLARTYTTTGQLSRARACLERVLELDPHNPEPALALGRSWAWEWVSSTEPSSFQSSVNAYLRAARGAPRDPEPRLSLAALALLRGDLALAS